MRTLLLAATLTIALPLAANAQMANDTFWENSSAGAKHIPSGGFCEPALFGLPLKATQSLNQKGTDAGCQYGEPGPGVISIYFTDFRPDTFEQVMSGAEQAMANRMEVPIDAAMSDFCDTSIDQALAEQSQRIGATTTPEADCAIVPHPKVTSLLATERVGVWTVKLRMTIWQTGPKATAQVMQAANLILQKQREAIAPPAAAN